MDKMWDFCLVLVWISVLWRDYVESDEYCLSEQFKPQCLEREVVVMQAATYGQMKKGKCIQQDFGHLGCFSDQLAYLDSQCSGKRQCEVDVSSREMIDSTTECPRELKLYLEASFYCQKVWHPRNDGCTSAETISLSRGNGFLASTIALDTNCGTTDAPWILEGDPGQKVNLTLIDFGWDASHTTGCNKLYGHILDYETEELVEICGGSERTKKLQLSVSHQVQIVLNHGAVQDNSFLIKYEVIGCRDYVPPAHAWVTKEDNGVTVGCHSGSETWQVKCIGNHWIGSVGNCSQTALPEPTATEKTGFNTDHVLSVAIGSLALVICCIVVTLGVYFVKKHQYKATYNSSGAENYVVPVPYRGANSQQPTMYTRFKTADRQQQNDPNQATAGRSNLPDIADLNNSTRTGYTFQRVPVVVHSNTMHPATTAVEVHTVPAHMVAARSRTLNHPSQVVAAAASQGVNSPRHRTMLSHRPSPSTSSGRTLPPPLPHRNEEATTLLSNNRPRGAGSAAAASDTESSPLHQSYSNTSSATDRNQSSDRGDQSPLYYVLETPAPINPTLNSDSESNT